MNTLVDKLNFVKTNIDSLKELADEATLEKTVSKIKRNYNASDEWKPEEGWWDIDSIIENDTENYVGKLIVLIRATENVHSFLNMFGASKIKMSDGQVVSEVGEYTWDTSKDKECCLGYKTRYLIFYYSSDSLNINFSGNTVFSTALYMIFHNVKTIKFATSATLCNGLRLLECIKTNVDLTITQIYPQQFNNCFRLQKTIGKFTVRVGISASNTGGLKGCYMMNKMEDFNFLFPNANSLSDVFSACNLNDIDLKKWGIVPSRINSMYNAFGVNVFTIKELDFENVTNVTVAFTSAINLYNIDKISNIKISGLDFSKCTKLNHDTLIRILNALYDYSNDTENTHTLILGAKNLAKLTEEEIAIATRKGWTLS